MPVSTLIRNCYTSNEGRVDVDSSKAVAMRGSKGRDRILPFSTSHSRSIQIHPSAYPPPQNGTVILAVYLVLGTRNNL